MNFKALLLSSIFFLLMTTSAFAHPGRTASDGCHYCRTNCDEWGVPWNERHCHGGGESIPVQESAPIQQRVIEQPTPYPTRKPTIPPTKTPSPSPTLKPTITSTPIPIQTKARTSRKAEREANIVDLTPKISHGFWEWILRLIKN